METDHCNRYLKRNFVIPVKTKNKTCFVTLGTVLLTKTYILLMSFKI